VRITQVSNNRRSCVHPYVFRIAKSFHLEVILRWTGRRVGRGILAAFSTIPSQKIVLGNSAFPKGGEDSLGGGGAGGRRYWGDGAAAPTSTPQNSPGPQPCPQV